MTQKRTLKLTEEQEGFLQKVRDHDPRPWARERCAAILKIAGGSSPYAVSQQGLLKRRDPDTVYFWLALYTEGGAQTLLTRQPGGIRRSRFLKKGRVD
jgi:hypothetical protein